MGVAGLVSVTTAAMSLELDISLPIALAGGPPETGNIYTLRSPYTLMNCVNLGLRQTFFVRAIWNDI